jgi:toxin HigB-1
MIKSFADKYTQMLFERKRVLKWKHIEDIARRKLRDLDKAISLEELAQIPSNRLHKLFGDRKGQRSITVKDQYRICFYWVKGDAYEVEITDYH